MRLRLEILTKKTDNYDNVVDYDFKWELGRVYSSSTEDVECISGGTIRLRYTGKNSAFHVFSLNYA